MPQVEIYFVAWGIKSLAIELYLLIPLAVKCRSPQYDVVSTFLASGLLEPWILMCYLFLDKLVVL
jgi:hypothetical protein